jgi:hypothetical protein
MDVFLPIAQVFVNPVEILLLSAIVGVLSGLIALGRHPVGKPRA